MIFSLIDGEWSMQLSRLAMAAETTSKFRRKIMSNPNSSPSVFAPPHASFCIPFLRFQERPAELNESFTLQVRIAIRR